MNKPTQDNLTFRLPATWEPQDAIVLVWPGKQDQDISEDILELYEALITVLIDYADVVVIAPTDQIESIKERLVLMEVPTEYVYFYDIPVPSINLHSYGPFIVESENQFFILATKGSFSESLYMQKAMPCAHLQHHNIHLSSDAIESDGGANLLVNLQRLCDYNPELTKEDIKKYIQQKIDAENILWVEELLDTNSFIRLCPGNKLVILDCDEKNSFYYEPIQNCKKQLLQQISTSGKAIELVSLPWAGVLSCDGIDYLADYSQFVVINEAVLVPLFDLPSDEDAMEIISEIFPGFDILGFPSISLAILKMSLAKVTQSIPEGVLEPL